jgi:hypothetical protein
MRKSVIPKLLGLILLIASVSLLIWGYYPQHEENLTLRIPGIGQQSLNWTSSFRAGDVGLLRLTLSSAELALDGNILLGDESGNLDPVIEVMLKDPNNIVAETRIELPGARILPGTEMSQPLRLGEDLKTIWQIMPLESGAYNGEVWLYLHPISENQGDGIRKPISILKIHLQSIDLFGVTGRQARISGIMGIGFVLLLWLGLNVKLIDRLYRQEGRG